MIRNIINLVRFLRILSKYQLITYPGNAKLPKTLVYCGYLVSLFTYPGKCFTRPKQDFGSRVADFCKSLGPIYIKFGQTLSVRPDLIGQEIADHLRHLQDKLPPFDFSIACLRIQQALECKIEEVFAKVDKIPAAAASIAQVHKAKLINGELVAVKILRPDIKKIYNNDIKFLEFIARIVTKFIPSTKRLKLSEVISVFRASMKCELDLRLEASAASRIADNFAEDTSLYIPKIYWNLTTEEVITTEWIDGISIYDRERLIQNGLNPVEIATKIAVIFFNQAYRDGFFHADLHPGNILVKKNGQVALIDFGITGSLSDGDRLAIAEILYGFLKRDYKMVARVHHQVGYIPKDTNLELFAQSCRAIAEPIIGKQAKDISIGNLLVHLFRVTEDFGMETQEQLLLLQRTMVVIEGIGQNLNPEVNMWQLAEPWMKKWAAKNLSPEAKLLKALRKFMERLGMM